MTAVLNLALENLDPADLDSEQAESVLWVGDLTVLAEHHTAPHGSHSYVVAHDTSATWGVPGAPQVVAIKVARDLSLGTFTLESEYHASVPFAQAWLIERDCPPERIALAEGDFVGAADEQTLRVQQKIRDGGQRYDVIDTWTWDSAPVRELDPGAGQRHGRGPGPGLPRSGRREGAHLHRARGRVPRRGHRPALAGEPQHPAAAGAR